MANELVARKGLIIKGITSSNISTTYSLYIDEQTGLIAYNTSSIISSGSAGFLPYYTSDGKTIGQASVLYWDDVLNRLGIGTASPEYTLDVNGSAIIRGTMSVSSLAITSLTGSNSNDLLYVDEYGNIGLTSSLSVSSINPGTAGYIAYYSSDGATLSSAGILFWDQSNERLGVGTASPSYTLDVTGIARVTEDSYINNIRIGRGEVNDSRNLVLGESVASTQTSGYNNVLIGNNAASNISTINSSTVIGYAAGFNATSLLSTVIIGHNTARASSTADIRYSTIIGVEAGRGLTLIATNNIFIGYNSGNKVSSGDSNVYLGSFDGTGFETENNNIFLSDGAGNVRVRVPSSGNFLIGTTTDAGYKLDVNGTARINNLIISSLTGSNADDVLYVDENGLVGITSSGPAANVNSGTAGYLAYYPTNGATLSSAGILFWNQSNNRLGIGTASPQYVLDVNGTASVRNNLIVNTLFIGRKNPNDIYGVNIGVNSGHTASTQTVTIGYNAGLSNKGQNNVHIGINAGRYFDDNDNTIIGALAAQNGAGGSNNTIVGRSAGDRLSGNSNVLLGSGVGVFATISNTTLIGSGTGYRTTSVNSVYIGYNTGYLADGNYNISLGYQSGYNIDGQQNVLIGGYRAGYNLLEGDYNVVLGSYDMSSFTNSSNAIYIADGSGDLRIYSPSSGNVIIGSSADAGYKLDVSGTFRVTSTSRLQGNVGIGTSSNNTNALNTNGTVMISSATTSALILKDTEGIQLFNGNRNLQIYNHRVASYSPSSNIPTINGYNNFIYGNRIYPILDYSFNNILIGEVYGIGSVYGKALRNNVLLGDPGTYPKSGTFSDSFYVGWAKSFYNANVGMSQSFVFDTQPLRFDGPSKYDVDSSVIFNISKRDDTYNHAPQELKNVFIAGGDSPITRVIFGNGGIDEAEATVEYTIYGSGILGLTSSKFDNVPAGNLLLSGGVASGNAVSGDVIVSTTTATGSSKQVQESVRRLWVKNNTGYIGIGTASPAYLLTVNGTVSIHGGLIVSGTFSSPYLNSTYFKQGGNTFSATAILGTKDDNDLRLVRNNSNKLHIANDYISIDNPAIQSWSYSSFTNVIHLNNLSLRTLTDNSWGLVSNAYYGGTSSLFYKSNTGVAFDFSYDNNTIGFDFKNDGPPNSSFTFSKGFRLHGNGAITIGTDQLPTNIRSGMVLSDNRSSLIASGFISLNDNAYQNSSFSWLRYYTGEAANMTIFNGDIFFRVAASGTTSSAISWDQALTLKNNGNLLVNTTTDAGYNFQVAGTGLFNIAHGTEEIVRIQNNSDDKKVLLGIGNDSNFEDGQGFIAFGSSTTDSYKQSINSFSASYTVPSQAGQVGLHFRGVNLIRMSNSVNYREGITLIGPPGTAFGLTSSSEERSVFAFASENNAIFNNTSGEVNLVKIGKQIDSFGHWFSPTSGDGEYNILKLSSSILQNLSGGTATGITRGLAFDMVMAGDIYDFRAIDIPSIAGQWAIYQSGANDKSYFNGSVLINSTTNPGYDFYVNGTASVNNLIIATVSAASGFALTSDGRGRFYGNNDFYVDIGNSLIVYRKSNGNTIYALSSNGDYSHRFDLYNGSNTVVTRFNSTGASYVNTGHNFLIGTSTDAGYKLEVDGTIRLNGVLTFKTNDTVIQHNNTSTFGNVVIGNNANSIGASQLRAVIIGQSNDYSAVTFSPYSVSIGYANKTDVNSAPLTIGNFNRNVSGSSRMIGSSNFNYSGGFSTLIGSDNSIDHVGTTQFTGAIAMGNNNHVEHYYSMIIGNNQYTTANNQLIIAQNGSNVADGYNDVYFGTGPRRDRTNWAYISDVTINGNGAATASNANGGSLILGSGKGSGTGSGGDVYLSTTVATASGSDLQPLIKRLTVKYNTGYVGIGTTEPSYLLTVNGTVSFGTLVTSKIYSSTNVTFESANGITIYNNDLVYSRLGIGVRDGNSAPEIFESGGRTGGYGGGFVFRAYTNGNFSTGQIQLMRMHRNGIIGIGGSSSMTDAVLQGISEPGLAIKRDTVSATYSDAFINVISNAYAEYDTSNGKILPILSVGYNVTDITTPASNATGFQIGWQNYAGVLQSDLIFTTVNDLKRNELIRFSGRNSNVIIGTSSNAPDAKLYIYGSASTLFNVESNNQDDILHVKNNGNVLINTSTDAGYKLDVQGTVRATGNLYLSGSDTYIYFNGLTDVSIRGRASNDRLDLYGAGGFQMNSSAAYYSGLSTAFNSLWYINPSVSGQGMVNNTYVETAFNNPKTISAYYGRIISDSTKNTGGYGKWIAYEASVGNTSSLYLSTFDNYWSFGSALTTATDQHYHFRATNDGGNYTSLGTNSVVMEVRHNGTIYTNGGVINEGKVVKNINVISGTYSVLETDYTIEATGTASYDIYLFDSTENTGQIYVIKNTGAGTKRVYGTASQTIDGDSFIDLAYPNSMTVQSNGTNWIII